MGVGPSVEESAVIQIMAKAWKDSRVRISAALPEGRGKGHKHTSQKANWEKSKKNLTQQLMI